MDKLNSSSVNVELKLFYFYNIDDSHKTLLSEDGLIESLNRVVKYPYG